MDDVERKVQSLLRNFEQVKFTLEKFYKLIFFSVRKIIQNLVGQGICLKHTVDTGY